MASEHTKNDLLALAFDTMAGTIDDLYRVIETWHKEHGFENDDLVQQLLGSSLGVANRGRIIAAGLREGKWSLD